MDRIKTLLLTGKNNHDWTRSAPFCRDLLAASGGFDVTLTESPANVLADAGEVAKYALFFFDWNDKAVTWARSSPRASSRRAWCAAARCGPGRRRSG